MGIALTPGRRKALQVTVTLGVLVALAATVDYQQAVDMVRRADAFTLTAMALLFPVDRLFMAWKWYLLARVRERTISFWTGTRIYLGSTTIGIFLPLGGLGPDLVRVAMLTRHGMASENAMASILVERMCGIAGAVLMLGSALILLWILLPGSNTGFRTLLPSAAGIAVVVVAATCAVFVIATRIGLTNRIGLFIGARPALRRFVAAVQSYSGHYRLLVMNVFLSWIEQFAPIIAFTLAAHGFGLPLTFLQCAAIIPLASVLERLPISFAGLGVREAGIVLAAGWFGVSSTESFLVSLFEQSVFILTMIPISLLYFVGNTK